MSDTIVEKWVSNLPGAGAVVIVSLLGRKPNGDSEFKFYSFRGLWDDVSGKSSFQEWIDARQFGRAIRIIEHPTIDQKIPADVLTLIATDVNRLLDQRACVILMDSGGMERVGQVCSAMGFERSLEKSEVR